MSNEHNFYLNAQWDENSWSQDDVFGNESLTNGPIRWF